MVLGVLTLTAMDARAQYTPRDFDTFLDQQKKVTDPRNVEPPSQQEPEELFMGGVDPLSYRVYGQPFYGVPQYTYVDGRTRPNVRYMFVSEVTYTMFINLYEKSGSSRRTQAEAVPKYGGNDAYGMAAGAKFSSDPMQFEIYKDNVYLFYSVAARRLWLQNRDALIAKADFYWNGKFNPRNQRRSSTVPQNR